MKENGESIKKPKGQTYKIAIFWVLILFLFICQLLVYTWSRVQCIRIGYEISREMENHQKLIEIQNRLKIEMARLRSPERISKIARSKLELVIPSPDQKKAFSVHETD
ncbi:MAG: cell division protein FtsL [Desulfococcus sp.]|nr:FtsL: predicted cell division protein FtsL [Desulfococcus multivorans]